MGISQHVHGTDNARCLIALALITGHVGRPGTGLHPLRGQNNVQGASDAGLIPMFYPDYNRVEDAATREKYEAFWGTSLDPKRGLTVVEIMNAARAGQINGMYIMGENPAMSDPDLAHSREAIASLQHLVVQDLFLTETAFMADVVLPASAFPEKTGTFTNTNRQVQLGRPALRLPGEARQDWWIIQEIARRMGLDWRYTHPRDVFDEMRQVMPSIANIGWDRLERESSVTYPCDGNDDPGREILFGDGFPMPEGRARIVAADLIPPDELPDEAYPMVLSTGRLLEHWHTGAMTRRSLVLEASEPEAIGCLGPHQLQRLGIRPGDKITVATRRGSVAVTARMDADVPEGMVFLPFCFAEAAANLLTNPQLDPFGKISRIQVLCRACRESASARLGLRHGQPLKVSWSSRSIRNTALSRRLQRIRIPLEFVEEAADSGRARRVARRSVVVELILHLRQRLNRGNARHSEFGEGGAKLHRRAHATEGAGGVTGDSGWPPEPLFEKVIQNVLQRRRDAVIVLAADDQKAIGRANDGRQLRQRVRRRTFRKLLEHLIEQRQSVFERIDEAHIMSARLKLSIEKARVLDPLALAAHRSVENREMQTHSPVPPALLSPPFRTGRVALFPYRARWPSSPGWLITRQRGALPQLVTLRSSQHAAKHPRRLLVHLHSLREQIGCRFVVRGIGNREYLSRRPDDGFLIARQLFDHLLGGRLGFLLADAGQARELRIAAGRRFAQRANALGDLVNRRRQFRVLCLEHLVQRIEHRPGHVPVEVVRLQVERVRIGQQARQPLSDGFAVIIAYTNLDL